MRSKRLVPLAGAVACAAVFATCGKSSSPGASSGTAGTSGVAGAGAAGAGGKNGGAGTGAAGALAGATGSAGAAAGSTGAAGSGDATAGASGTAGAGGAPSHTPLGVYTQHIDIGRTGAYTDERILTPANVNMAKFGKQFALPVDGYLYAQPLYVPNVTIPGKGVHNVVYIATEHDSVYAFDADTKQAPLWQVSFLSTGVTSVPEVDTSSPVLKPEVGITGTPVIDPATSTIYLVADTKEAGPKYVQRLHALDLATGAEKLGGPVIITGSVTGKGGNNAAPATPGTVVFDPLRELQRPGLALSQGMVWVAYTGNGDHLHWHGGGCSGSTRRLSPRKSPGAQRPMARRAPSGSPTLASRSTRVATSTSRPATALSTP